jgi:hypothetical protein
MDWYVLLTPILLLPIVSLLVFVGCSLETTGAFKGVPVTIYCNWDPNQLAGYVKQVDFWCEYNDNVNPLKTTPSSPVVTDFSSPQARSLTLTGDFEPIGGKQPLLFYCTAKGNAWRTDLINWEPIQPSDSLSGEFHDDDHLYFELLVIPPNDTEPAKFKLAKLSEKKET